MRGVSNGLWKITVTNHGKMAAPLHVLPMIWFRNVWSWAGIHKGSKVRPSLTFDPVVGAIRLHHEELGELLFHSEAEDAVRESDWLFTENETNMERLFGSKNASPYTKDAFHRRLVNDAVDAVNPARTGTKGAAHWAFEIPAGATVVVRCRLHPVDEDNGVRGIAGFEETQSARIAECDEFYRDVLPAKVNTEDAMICRQGYAGLLWTKQFYEYIVDDWINGESDEPAPPESRNRGRNHDWGHFFARDVLSMPDKWEYPWFAAWDTAFHMLPFVKIDPDFAKSQLLLLLREWYMHPNGQLPAYEHIASKFFEHFVKITDAINALSGFGIRSLSKIHEQEPFRFNHGGEHHEVSYVPGESDSWMFGGNSNWRGPVWFPVNYLIVEALERYHHFYGDSFKIEAPAGSGRELALDQVADLISERLISIFQKDTNGYRPCFGGGIAKRYDDAPTWQNLVLFHEYFHAETGEGLGASHQTGWTSLVVRLVRERAEKLTDHHQA